MAPLDDLDLLRVLTQRLAATRPARGPLGRLVTTGDETELLAALFAELSATVLDRQLAFTAHPSAPPLLFEMSDARVLAASPMPGQPVAPITMADRLACLAHLRKWLSGASELWVLVKPPTVRLEKLNEGMSVAELRDGPILIRPGHLERLLPLSVISKAWLRQAKDRPEEHGGEADAVAALREAALARLDGLRSQAPGRNESLIILGPQGGLITVIVLDRDASLILLLTEHRLDEVLARARGDPF